MARGPGCRVGVSLPCLLFLSLSLCRLLLEGGTHLLIRRAQLPMTTALHNPGDLVSLHTRPPGRPPYGLRPVLASMVCRELAKSNQPRSHPYGSLAALQLCRTAHAELEPNKVGSSNTPLTALVAHQQGYSHSQRRLPTEPSTTRASRTCPHRTQAPGSRKARTAPSIHPCLALARVRRAASPAPRPTGTQRPAPAAAHGRPASAAGRGGCRRWPGSRH